MAIINGRLSLRSHRGYRRLRGPLGPTIRRLDAVAAQTEEYAERFIDLGVPRRKVLVTGSVKYDGLESDRSNRKTLELRKGLGILASDIVFVAGSTMEGEEAAALDAYRAARVDHPRLRLILVPRHPDRFERVATWLRLEGEVVVRRSEPGSPLPYSPTPPVVLVDTIGELSAVWRTLPSWAEACFPAGAVRT